MGFTNTVPFGADALPGPHGKRTRSTTRQRGITRVLLDAKRPLSMDEIHRQASQEVATVRIATVRRAVAGLEEVGQVRQLLLPKDSPRYEPASLAQHECFRFLVCNRVYWVFLSPAWLSDMTPDGFLMDSHQVVLYGTCAACRR